MSRFKIYTKKGDDGTTWSLKAKRSISEPPMELPLGPSLDTITTTTTCNILPCFLHRDRFLPKLK